MWFFRKTEYQLQEVWNVFYLVSFLFIIPYILYVENWDPY